MPLLYVIAQQDTSSILLHKTPTIQDFTNTNITISPKKETSHPSKNHQYSEIWITELLIKFGSISVSWHLLDSILQNLMKHDCPFGKFPSPKSFILRVALKSKLSSLLKSFRTVYFMRFYICAYNNSKVNPIQTHLGHLITQLSSTSNISMNCPILCLQ